MKDREILKHLKRNTIAYGLLTDDQKLIFINVGRKNCLYYTGYEWVKCTSPDISFVDKETYRVVDSFEFETKYKRIQISVVPYGRVYRLKTALHEVSEYNNTYLSSAYSALGFAGVIYKDPITGIESPPMLNRPVCFTNDAGGASFESVMCAFHMQNTRPAVPIFVVLLVEDK